MDSDLKELLAKNLEISKENNAMLRKQWQIIKRGRFLKFIYWVTIIILAMSSYYYMQPYIDNLLKTYGNIRQDLKGFSGIQNFNRPFLK